MVGAGNMTARSNLTLTPSPSPSPRVHTRRRDGVGEGVRPHLDHELNFMRAGLALVAGIDEAGRGAWAGPVVAAAVILDLHQVENLSQVNDSKQLLPRKREELYQVIIDNALAYGLGQASTAEIDTIGILPATRLAMMRAVEDLSPQPQALIIDAVHLPKIDLPQSVFNFADSISLSVAAASILAKVTRDRLMIDLDAQFPLYCFARHKGYGTRIHQDALQSVGPCEIHRKSFKPIAALLADRLL
jgi:ribonuclease HII